MTTRTSTVTGTRPASGPVSDVEVPAQVGRGGGPVEAAGSPGRVRPASAPAPAAPSRPAGRRDACRPAGRPAPVATPLVRPWPSADRVNSAGEREHARARSAVLRRRRTVATVVLGVVLLGLITLAVRLGGAVEASTPDGPVPTGSTVVVVPPGESLLDVAQRAAPTADADAVVARIRTANHLSGSSIVVGRPLVVPAGS